MKCVFWFKKDLRLYDNTALIKASEECDQVYPIVVFDSRLTFNDYTSNRRLYFYLQALKSLSRRIPITILNGDTVIEIKKFMRNVGAEYLFYNKDFDPFINYDELCKQVKCKSYKDFLIVEPGELPLYKIFTPYYKRWRDVQKEKPRGYPSGKFLGDRSEVPELVKAFEIPKADEDSALETLRSFNESLYSMTYTSRLSPYINTGLISIRVVYWGVKSEEFRRQLAWRDFYYQLYTLRRDYLETGIIRRFNSNIKWKDNEEEFNAWTNGMTGIPIIDAGMRELNSTGYIHNRIRLLVSYFLTKVLGIDWRKGAKYFMQQLLDGDYILNTANWQWVAGVGADTRIHRRFNIISQGKMYDSKGEYIKRWVTELSNVPQEYIHEPWKMSYWLQREVGVIIGKDYPYPIADPRGYFINY
ncbi:MAG: deoxyribodipyrimidine photo-lyase [Sulfolobaceae archaeon]|nr:deoxyribodipyrimidine photo-lyase [Sulfolobaceae archaeon]